ncbi:MAG: acetylglutamate kinase [Candidatus Sumerlaeia bacterium]|nr:acetylglutamate kinase [Candidatus Sumerlaeia bacterium]
MQEISILKQAIPFVRRFKGSLFVLKFGGEAIRTQDALDRLCEDISFLHDVGIRVIIVHGGGKQVTELEGKLGAESRFVAGRRVTSPESLEALKMVLAGKLNIELVATLQGMGMKAIGLSGVSCGIINATKRPPKKVTGSDEVVDFGEVGDIQSVDKTILESLLAQGCIPVVSPLAADRDGRILNVNADVAAAKIASSFPAEKLLLMSDTQGVMTDLNDPTSMISQLDATQAREAIRQGIIKGGMIPKVEMGLGALEAGVNSVHILSATEPNTLLLEIFTESGCGTMLIPG